MSTETSVTNLKINKVTKAQYDTITRSATEAYEITDLGSILDSKQTTSNLVTTISASSTDAQYPSAKCVYDALQSGSGVDSSQLSYYGTCDTAAATRDKIVVCPELTELKAGVSIGVKFVEASGYNGVSRLNVNNTGLKSIYVTGGATVKTRYYWRPDELVSFTYDGTYWVMEEAGLADTTYYGMTKLVNSATSTSSSLSLSGKSLNSLVQYMIEPYPIYSSSSTYAVGDRVRYSYNVYECIVAIETAEAWTADHWKALDPIQDQLDDKVNTSDLATVATSGSYNDLSNKPTIPDTSNLANKDLSNLSSTGNSKFQVPLVSGTNIKTINNNSILGSGNLTLDGLPSQTGKAGKFLQTDGTDASWESAPFRNIGEIVASTIPLTDAGLHLLDGSLILGSGIYSDFVDYIAGLDLTANYFCTEAEWQTAVTTYGVCGKFVYDSVNNTVRLPKITGILEGTIDVTALGDLVEAGLPNITGNVLGCAARENNTTGKAFQSASGAFSVSGGAIGSTGSMLGNANSNIYFDASNSSSIYGNSSTVQPQTIKAFYYIVIATSTKTDIQVDIDEVVTDLNGKADVDLTNCTKPHIVETYINGSSWYRVYSDGWCEQGGLIVQNSNYTRTINLLKSYSNTNYICIVCAGANSYTGSSYGYIGTRNTDSFQCVILDNASINACWQASGYIS